MNYSVTVTAEIVLTQYRQFPTETVVVCVPEESHVRLNHVSQTLSPLRNNVNEGVVSKVKIQLAHL
jgi:hypothetical protein